MLRSDTAWVSIRLVLVWTHRRKACACLAGSGAACVVPKVHTYQDRSFRPATRTAKTCPHRARLGSIAAFNCRQS